MNQTHKRCFFSGHCGSRFSLNLSVVGAPKVYPYRNLKIILNTNGMFTCKSGEVSNNNQNGDHRAVNQKINRDGSIHKLIFLLICPNKKCMWPTNLRCQTTQMFFHVEYHSTQVSTCFICGRPCRGKTWRAGRQIFHPGVNEARVELHLSCNPGDLLGVQCGSNHAAVGRVPTVKERVNCERIG